MDEWRSTTYGEMYEHKLVRLGELCDDLKTVVMRISPVGMSIDSHFNGIKEMIEEIKQIKSDGGILPLLRKLREP